MLKLFRNFRKQEWLLVLLALVFIVTQVWLDLTMPEYMAEITRLVQTSGSSMPEILSAGGMMLLCEKRKAVVVGVGIAVEKGFQPGGRKLRDAGVKVVSLAIVDAIEDGRIVLRDEA